MRPRASLCFGYDFQPPKLIFAGHSFSGLQLSLSRWMGLVRSPFGNHIWSI